MKCAMPEEVETSHLLLVNCSAQKNPQPGLLPAIERYRGVVFQVIRKARREGYWPCDCRVAIVSARYGLVKESTPLEWYDLKMTKARARSMQVVVSSSLDLLLQTVHCQTVFLALGSTYRLAIGSSVQLELLRRGDRVIEARGGLGAQLQQLQRWLLARHDQQRRCV
jgi:hypothetical protein